MTLNEFETQYLPIKNNQVNPINWIGEYILETPNDLKNLNPKANLWSIIDMALKVDDPVNYCIVQGFWNSNYGDKNYINNSIIGWIQTEHPCKVEDSTVMIKLN